MSVRPTVIESHIRAERLRAQEASHQTLHRIGEVQSMFPNMFTGSFYECPPELPKPPAGSCPRPKIAIFQHSDLLEPALSWQRELFPGNAAPLADPQIPMATTSRICIVNAAHDERAGGDWMSSISTQEDSICRRSTLYHALMTPATKDRQSFYPIESGGIYSPNVIVHREGPSKVYELYTSPDECTVISIVSVPPERTPMLSPDGKYLFELERELQKNKMRTALRIAAKHRHRNIVIGMFGSVNREVPEYSTRRNNRGGGLGGQGPLHDERRDINPIREVASMWAELLDDARSEFVGHFDKVVFIVGVGQRATEEAHALAKAFKLPDVPRIMKEWYPGQYDFAYRE